MRPGSGRLPRGAGAWLAPHGRFDYRPQQSHVPGVPFSDRCAAQIRRLHAASGASHWNVSLEHFTEALAASAVHRWRGDLPDDDAVERYLDGLAVQDLALACGCRQADERAWEHFVTTYRPVLYASGRAIAGERGRELADSVYADLYGTAADRPDRRSLFAYYHGRSSLATWLRAVLVRRHIDAVRADARTEPLADPEASALPPGGRLDPPDPERTRYVRLAQQALDTAIAALDAGDRLRLRLYYGEGLTLAEIGRIVHEHEATVSRRLARVKRELKAAVTRVLRERGLAGPAVEECLEYAADAPELHLTRLLSPGEDG